MATKGKSKAGKVQVGKSKAGSGDRKAAVMAGPAANGKRARAGSAAGGRKLARLAAKQPVSQSAKKSPPRRGPIVRQPSMSERSYAIKP